MIPFAILGVVAFLAAILVVATRNPVLSAMWLALNFAAVAGIFILLGAEFLAAIQIIVYAGAILVFFLFVIMLLNLGNLPVGESRPVQRWLGLYLTAVLAVAIAFAIRAGGDDTPAADAADLAGMGNTEALGNLLYRDYVLPFELVSVLLTAAVVGAVVLTKKRTSES